MSHLYFLPVSLCELHVVQLLIILLQSLGFLVEFLHVKSHIILPALQLNRTLLRRLHLLSHLIQISLHLAAFKKDFIKVLRRHFLLIFDLNLTLLQLLEPLLPFAVLLTHFTQSLFHFIHTFPVQLRANFRL